MSDEEDFENQAHQALVQAINRHLDQIRPAYAQALASLWLANAGAALAVLSFIGATPRTSPVLHQLIWPLSFFLLGLISMGIGTGVWLWEERQRIRSMEDANSISDWILSSKVGRAKRPSEELGLSIRDWRTSMALFSATFFVLGCLIGLCELSAN
jgi:hypothetical protein